jgi:hypothetical protein
MLRRQLSFRCTITLIGNRVHLMPALDNIAFVPPHTAGGELISAFGADKSDPFLIKAAQAFTIELETVMVPQEHQKRLLPQVSLPFLDGEKDMLVLSASSTSDHPEVQRVHYFGQAPEFRTPHSNFQSNTMYLTSDYNGKDQLQVSVRLVEVDTSNEERDTFLSEFQNLAGGAGALFPAVLPYVSAGVQLGKAIDKVISAVKPSNESRLVNRLNFHAQPNENQIALRLGRYVFFEHDLDSTKLSLSGNNRLLRDGKEVLDIAYVVCQIVDVSDPSPDYVVSQRVATLLTGLDRAHANVSETAVGFLQDTLNAYTDFSDLQRYVELWKKSQAPGGISDDERKLMTRIAAKGALTPFIANMPVPTAPAMTA